MYPTHALTHHHARAKAALDGLRSIPDRFQARVRELQQAHADGLLPLETLNAEAKRAQAEARQQVSDLRSALAEALQGGNEVAVAFRSAHRVGADELGRVRQLLNERGPYDIIETAKATRDYQALAALRAEAPWRWDGETRDEVVTAAERAMVDLAHGDERTGLEAVLGLKSVAATADEFVKLATVVVEGNGPEAVARQRLVAGYAENGAA